MSGGAASGVIMQSPRGTSTTIALAADGAEAPTRAGPVIAVLPLANLGEDPEQRYLSDGITEDIVTELSRFREIQVIGLGSSLACEPFAGDVKRVARELSAQYVLEGSVRRAGARLRITARLIDGARGEQIWADRQDGAVDDVLDLQDEIARRIVGSIAPEIHLAEQHRADRHPMGDVQAYDLALKAGALIARGVDADDAGSISDGIRLAERAVALDPACLRAHYAIAWGHCRRGAMSSFRPGATEDFAAADAAALRLRQLDQGNHAAYAILGHVAMRRLRHEESLANLRQAHELNPNDVTTLRWLAWEEANWGMADAAREHAAMAMRLSPRDRAIDLGYWTVALAAFVAGEGERCLENAKRAIALNRRFAGHYILLAACLAEHGDLAEAKATAEVAMAMAPGLIESRAAGNTYFVAPSLAERYAHALRRAIGERAAPAPPAAVPAAGEPPAALETLTARECQVLRLVAQGLSNPAIAMALALSEHTVKRHVANILTKLDLPTRAAASALAARRGLL